MLKLVVPNCITVFWGPHGPVPSAPFRTAAPRVHFRCHLTQIGFLTIDLKSHIRNISEALLIHNKKMLSAKMMQKAECVRRRWSSKSTQTELWVNVHYWHEHRHPHVEVTTPSPGEAQRDGKAFLWPKCKCLGMKDQHVYKKKKIICGFLYLQDYNLRRLPTVTS